MSKKKDRTIIISSLCFIFLFITTPLFFLLLFQQSPNQVVESTITYDPALMFVDGATSTPLGTEGLEVGLYADGVFVQYLYSDASSMVSWNADLTKDYTLNITQGADSTVFAIDLFGTNDFEIGGWRVDLDFSVNGEPMTYVDLDMYMLVDSVWVDIGDFFIFQGTETITLPVGTFGILNPTVSAIYNFDIYQTDLQFVDVVLVILEWIKIKRKKKKREREKIKMVQIVKISFTMC